MSNDRARKTRPPRKAARDSECEWKKKHKPSPRRRNKQHQNQHTAERRERRQRERERKIKQNQGSAILYFVRTQHTEGQVRESEKRTKKTQNEVDKGPSYCGWWLVVAVVFFFFFCPSCSCLSLVLPSFAFVSPVLSPVAAAASIALFLYSLSLSLYFSYSFLGRCWLVLPGSLLLGGSRVVRSFAAFRAGY